MNAGNFAGSLLILLFVVDALAGEAAPPAMVQVEEVLNTEIASTIMIPGTVISRDDSRISPKVKGTITRILDVGDSVNKGETLFEVDAIEYQLELQELEKSMMSIEAQMMFYQRESGRLEKLAQENNAARNRLDQAQSEYSKFFGELNVVEARIKRSRDEIRRTKILAPFSGVITERFKAVGEYADPGDDVLRLVNQENLEIQARTPQYTVPFIRRHKSLTVVGGDRNADFDIRTIVPVGDRVSRLYELRLEFDGDYWMAGHAVKVAVPIGESKSVIVVSHDALVIRRDGTKLFRINQDNIAELVPVTTGIANRKYIEVNGDIHAGDRVVIRGNERLRPGQAVQIQVPPAGL